MMLAVSGQSAPTPLSPPSEILQKAKTHFPESQVVLPLHHRRKLKHRDHGSLPVFARSEEGWSLSSGPRCSPLLHFSSDLHMTRGLEDPACLHAGDLCRPVAGQERPALASWDIAAVSLAPSHSQLQRGSLGVKWGWGGQFCCGWGAATTAAPSALSSLSLFKD